MHVLSHPSRSPQRTLPIVIIGAGPIGLAAAAHLLQRGETPLVLEAGATVGANIAQWGHVQFFSPWKYCVDTATRALLETQGWSMPDPEAYPTGRELVARYLAPLAATPQLAPHLRFGAHVVAITRRGFDKMKTDGRDAAPFLLQIHQTDGTANGQETAHEETILARAVIDASGTWNTSNPLGASGLPASGERELAAHIAYGISDVLGAKRTRYAGRRVLVAGSGHSAFNTIVDLAALAQQAPGTNVTWIVRRPAESAGSALFGGGDDDALPARGALGQRVHALVEADMLQLITGFKALALRQTPAGIIVSGERDGIEAEAPAVDELIVATGFRPNLAPLAELRLALDPSSESPVALAPLIDPNVHSCGTVPPHGAVELAHPERDFYVVGMKSYGRAPTFLLLTGYEQVRSVAAALAGDWAAAREVRLVLPETGVCSSGGDSGSCCGSDAVPTIADGTLVPASAGATQLGSPLLATRRTGKPLSVNVLSVGGAPTEAGSAARADVCCE